MDPRETTWEAGGIFMKHVAFSFGIKDQLQGQHHAWKVLGFLVFSLPCDPKEANNFISFPFSILEELLVY